MMPDVEAGIAAPSVKPETTEAVITAPIARVATGDPQVELEQKVSKL